MLKRLKKESITEIFVASRPFSCRALKNERIWETERGKVREKGKRRKKGGSEEGNRMRKIHIPTDLIFENHMSEIS